LEKYHTSNCEKDLNYNIVFRFVNAADYGIPQKRERVFIVGFRNDINGKWSFPEATHSDVSLNYSKYITKEYWEKHSISFKGKKNINVSLFDDIKKPWVTVRDAISDLPNPININMVQEFIPVIPEA
jgi:DNA (cytosine-5)-methyltransferase 1